MEFAIKVNANDTLATAGEGSQGHSSSHDRKGIMMMLGLKLTSVVAAEEGP